MKQLLACLLLAFLGIGAASAQKMEGEVTYERTYHWTRIYSRLTFLSNEEKDRIKMTWGNNDEYKRKMAFYFTPDKSLYTYPKEQDNEGGWSWRESEYRIYRDFAKEKGTDVIQMLDKIYIVEDSLNVPKWKVMNKIKEIAGYMCMMAVTEDTIKNHKITAWFADNLPVSGGPELYYGLPGLILELDINDGDVVTTALKVDLKPVKEELEVPKKLKGKRINHQQYIDLISNHIKDSIKAHRNPYWAMPY